MLQKRKLFIGLIILFSSVLTKGQEIHLPEKNLMSVSSPKGNFIYFFNGMEISGVDTFVQKNTAYFTIERAKFDVTATEIKENVFKKVGQSKMSTSVKELNKIFGLTKFKEIQKLLGLSSDDAVANYFNTRKQIESYPIMYDFIETKQALGHVFLDENVIEGEVYLYVVKRVTTSNNTEDWGYAITQSKSGNYFLPYYKPLLANVTTGDSLVSFTWKMPIPQGKLSTIPIPKSNIDKDTITGVLRILLTPAKTRANLFIKSKNGFVNTETLLPVLNETEDTITYQYQKRCNPEETVTAYLQTEDEVYNKGIESDTAYTIALDQKSIPLIYSVRLKEIVNGIQLSWDKLPNKPYITGIEIGRYNSDEKYDSVATVSATDTSFTDYKIAVGQHYRYKVKAVFLPELNIEQAVPAEAVGTFTVFNRPLPVTNLSIENKNKLPFLKWDEVKDPSFYGSYIYRGTSPKNLSVIAGPIKNNYFVDSATSVTGRNEYYYAIVNQNLREDTSLFSEVVRLVPDKSIDITYPSTMEFYYANGKLNISWNDVRAMDNTIESFVVHKKIATQKTFSILGNSTNNNIEDADIKDGVTYEYRVVAITYKGDTSEYSNGYTFALESKEIPQVNIFYTRNISEGIEISWPSVIYQNRKNYNIYRRLATEQNFTKLATVPSNTFLYVDKISDENKIYVYKISITQNDGKEGEKGKPVSIRRLKK